MKAIVLGIIASFFFASSFVLNRSIDIGGGSWIWSGVLRYVFMLPILMIVVILRGNFKELISHMRNRLWSWLIWSSIGFGVFYSLVCFSASYGPSWLVASTWQITIIAGSLLVPFFYEVIETPSGTQRVRGKIPIKGILISTLILFGVVLVHLQQANQASISDVLLVILPVGAAAIAYPLGNRKMMEICGQRLDTYQRVLGMTIASMPFWTIMSLYGLVTTGSPSSSQVLQSLIVAVCSGVIATLLFFRATDLSNGDVHKLAAVEATQSGEVVFALLGELLILNGKIPDAFSLTGMALVMIGMILHSYASANGVQVGLETQTIGTDHPPDKNWSL